MVARAGCWHAKEATGQLQLRAWLNVYSRPEGTDRAVIKSTSTTEIGHNHYVLNYTPATHPKRASSIKLHDNSQPVCEAQ